MATTKDLFIVGLRNAHAMETQAREMLERQAGRLDDYPEVKTKVVSHRGDQAADGALGRMSEVVR
jgi:ferritin-like metal-binding protein YciE